jgi:hypothetical protein
VTTAIIAMTMPVLVVLLDEEFELEESELEESEERGRRAVNVGREELDSVRIPVNSIYLKVALGN